MLKIIQLGLTFMDEKGETPAGVSTWQFNFKFNLTLVWCFISVLFHLYLIWLLIMTYF